MQFIKTLPGAVTWFLILAPSIAIVVRRFALRGPQSHRTAAGNDRGDGEVQGCTGSRAGGTMRDGSSMDLHDNNNVEDSFIFGGWQKRTTRAILTVWRRIKAAFGDG